MSREKALVPLCCSFNEETLSSSHRRDQSSALHAGCSALPACTRFLLLLLCIYIYIFLTLNKPPPPRCQQKNDKSSIVFGLLNCHISSLYVTPDGQAHKSERLWVPLLTNLSDLRILTLQFLTERIKTTHEHTSNYAGNDKSVK